MIGDGPEDGGGGNGGSGGTGGGGGVVTADERLDLLLVVDNSIGMAHAQARFAKELEQTLRWLTSPPCLAANGAVVESAGECPAGSARPFAPVRNIHLGVISSSLGDLTSGACRSSVVLHADDKGRLLSRGLAGSTYQDLGFLAYDADGVMSPPGEASLEAFIASAKQIVLGTDEAGCGYEMPLEAMTRFLVDPAPYASLSVVQGALAKSGVDSVVLEQRAAFLRPTSNLAVVLLSNENDCSTMIEFQGFLALNTQPFYRSTSICETAPESACCTSCGLPTPDGCEPDAACANPKYNFDEDHPNLKCFDQKGRYGVDFLYPTERYVNALSSSQIDPSSLSLVGVNLQQNPIFAGGRQAGQVTLQTIVGVPWQDIVEDPANAASPTVTTTTLAQTGAWEWVTGAVQDPFARESVKPRTGQSPATGDTVTADNAINGGERTISENDSLQYACTFGLPEEDPNGIYCSTCIDQSCDDPICNNTTQIASFAMPGTRQLEVVRGLGERGVVGSVCRDPEVNGSAQALIARLANLLP